jgi:hypothetical protein
MSYFDIAAIVVILVIFVIAHNALVVHPLELLLKVFSEFRQLRQTGVKTTGAVNALGLIVVAVIGGLIFITDVFHALLGLVEQLLRPQQAHQYVASVSALTLFIAIVMLAALSALLTLLAERPPRS